MDMRHGHVYSAHIFLYRLHRITAYQVIQLFSYRPLSLGLFTYSVSHFSLSPSLWSPSILVCVLYIISNIVPVYNVHIIHVYLKKNTSNLGCHMEISRARTQKQKKFAKQIVFLLFMWLSECVWFAPMSQNFIEFFVLFELNKKVKGLKGCVRDWAGHMNFSWAIEYTLCDEAIHFDYS